MTNAPFSYLTIEQDSSAEYVDRGSRFIAFAFPISSEDAFRERLRTLRKEHPKAVHLCYAWRFGSDGARCKSSDAGEPSGSAGKPILGQLESLGITNAAIIVVRYFGGTLLGVPGLIHAYRSAAALALQIIPRIEKSVEATWQLDFDYTLLNEVMTVLKRNNSRVIHQDVQMFCRLLVGIPLRNLDTCLPQLQSIYRLDISPVRHTPSP